MSSAQQSFISASSEKAFDKEHRRKVFHNVSKCLTQVEIGKTQFDDLEKAKKTAKNAKWEAIANLDALLLQFEHRFTQNGGKVIWANTADEAINEISRICAIHDVKKVVKSKSMATEEIHLNEALESVGVEPIETDLGEYIVQMANEKPYHIVTPAMHKSKEEVAELFHKNGITPPEATPEECTLAARGELRKQYTSAELGITGANFILPDIGAVAVTENEGNARLTTTFPKVHVAIVGIDKMLPSSKHLELFWPLLATHGTGQKITVYNSLFRGPKTEKETDGPEHAYVILLDNGRTELLSNPTARESMYCIRCGACLNVCPIYRTVGGHSYGTVYSGPIGKVITPFLKGQEGYGHLSHASSLCGKCTEVCPVKIDLHNLLLTNRHDQNKAEPLTGKEAFAWKMWQRTVMKRRSMNKANSGLKQWILNRSLKQSWNKHHAPIEFPKKTFNQLWKELEK